MTAAQKALDALEAALDRPCKGDACGPSGECGPCCDRSDIAVNLAAPLAAVVRAAMEHMSAWEALHAAMDPSVCERDFAPAQVRRKAAEVAMRAALDSFNAAAAAQGFGP